MNIDRLRVAISLVRDEQVILGARQITYLETYPAMLALARTPTEDAISRFFQLSAAAYGWMPRVLRIDKDCVERAVGALAKAARETGFNAAAAEVEEVALCLSSVVGSSKVLHFTNPEIYPIWDSRVQRVWGRTDPTQKYMSEWKHYVYYATEVHQLRKSGGFHDFAAEFRDAYAARLERLGIRSYPLTDTRVIEAAAFERSGGEYEDD